MQIKDLNPHKKNPRKISPQKLEALKKSLEKLGDLSGFVYNRRTKTLVSGHQRQKALPPKSTIKTDQKYETPTRTGTVAEGYVLIEGERFKYREVDWDEQTEMEALLAANKHGGEWDEDLLKIAFADFPTMNFEIAGFDAPKFNLPAPTVQPVAVSEEPEETDEQYAARTSNTGEERVQTVAEELNQSLPTTYDTVKEDTTSKNVK